MTAVNFCAGAFLPMILPFVTERLGGSSAEYGLYMAAYPLGFMLGPFTPGGSGNPRTDGGGCSVRCSSRAALCAFPHGPAPFPSRWCRRPVSASARPVYRSEHPLLPEARPGGSARKSLRPAHVDRPVRVSPGCAVCRGIYGMDGPFASVHPSRRDCFDGGGIGLVFPRVPGVKPGGDAEFGGGSAAGEDQIISFIR